jgi:hypothetical protein
MSSQTRYNIYDVIHKALRARLSRTLVAIGQLDVDDEGCVRELAGEVTTTLAIMRGHLHSENDFVHVAMEARAPGSTRRIAEEHLHHEQDILVIEDACGALLAAAPAERAARASRLYVLFEVFLQDNFTHMRYEEDHHNAVLWAAYTDEEILGIEHALVAAIAPEKKALILHSMVPAVPTRERAKLLGGLRAVMPPEVFAGLYASVVALLDAGARQRLEAALAAEPEGVAA